MSAGLIYATTSLSISLVQPPNGRTISGTYQFEVKLIYPDNEAIPAPVAVIAGTSYTTALISRTIVSGYTDAIFGYQYPTGAVSNGQYSWYATDSGYTTTTDSFTVANYITIMPQNPVSGAVVSSTTQFIVAAVPSSINTVQGVAMYFEGQDFTMKSIGGNGWIDTLNTLAYPNGVVTASYSATGSGGTSGSGSVGFVVENRISSNYQVNFTEGLHGYISNLTAQLNYGMTAQEGYYQVESASLALLPNTLVSRITITNPDTIPGMAWMYFPFTSSDYAYSATHAADWAVANNNVTYPSGAVQTKFWSFPYLAASQDTLTAQYPLMPVNLTTNWTVGGVFNLSQPGEFFGGHYLNFVAVQATSSSFYPSVEMINQSKGTTYEIISNQSVPYQDWFSFAVALQPGSNALSGDSLWIDGQEVGSHIAGSIVANEWFSGMGTSLSSDNGSMLNLFGIRSYMTAQDAGILSQPELSQLPNGVSPPLYDITQSYYQITISNGSQPWPSYLSLQLNQFIGISSSAVTLSLTSVFGPQPFQGYGNNVTYTPFMSLSTQSLSAPTSLLSLPLGASLTIVLSNVWNQTIGRISNLVLSQSTMDVQVNLNLAQLSFAFYNTVPQFVFLTANGITSQVYAEVYAGVGYTYTWNTTVFQNGQNTIYSGTVDVTQINQVLSIYADPPEATLAVSVFAYNGSQQGELFSSGSPMVNLYINGHLFPVGATFNGTVDQNVNITVTDQLNQTLYSANYTLGGLSNSLVVDIVQPSFVLQIHNDEQANPKSPLSTETITINNSASKGIFTNSVGDSLIVYLKAGKYSLSLHDNATFNTTVNLSANAAYDLFGQQLLTTQQFLQMESAMYNNTAHLQVLPIASPLSILAGAPLQYDLGLSFPNGTELDLTQTRQVIQNGTFVAHASANGTVIEQATLNEIAANEIGASLLIRTAGSYNIAFQSFFSSGGTVFSLEYTSVLSVYNIANFSYGITLKVSGPSVIQINRTASFVLLLAYSNGTALNYTDTLAVAKNITVDIYNNGQFIQTVPVTVVAGGRLSFTYTPLQASQGYSIVATVSPTTIGTAKASAEYTESLSAVNYNPSISPGQDVLNTLINTLFNSANLLAVIFGVAAGAYGAYRLLRRRSIRVRAKLDAIDSAIQAQVISQGLSAEEQKAIVSAIPKKVRKRLMGLLKQKGDL